MVATDGATPLVPGSQTKLVTAKTRRGRRFLENRAPKAVEDAKRCLFLYGNNTSAVVKDAVTDLYQLKKLEAQKFTRKNENVRPFEAGGEASLEFYCSRSHCSLFCLGSHSKKRPHNLVLGRMHDFRLYDALELGIDDLRTIREFGAAGAGAQLGNKPCIIFVGEKFESVPALKLARSLLLDMFRGEQIEKVNLAGIDRVLMAVATDDTHFQVRQYTIRFKKSGTRVPRVALAEMGPRMALCVRRYRAAPPDVEREAMRQPHLGPRKKKNISGDNIQGRVGRIYMPKQDVASMGLAKYKGTKRGRREDAAAAAAAKKQPRSGGGRGRVRGGGDDDDGGGSDDE